MKVGKFVGKACGVDYGRTKTGNEFIAVTLQFDSDIDTWTGYLNSDANIERTLTALRLMGWSGSDAGSITVADLPGYVQVEVRQDKDKDGNLRVDERGNPIGRPAFINPVGGRALLDPLDTGARKAIGMRLRAKAAAAPVVAPVLEMPKATMVGNANPDDDPGIPF